MDDTNESQLIAALRDADSDAWAQVVRRWAGPLFDHLLAASGDVPRAVGLVEETFERAADSLTLLRADTSIRAHLFGAACGSNPGAPPPPPNGGL